MMGEDHDALLSCQYRMPTWRTPCTNRWMDGRTNFTTFDSRCVHLLVQNTVPQLINRHEIKFDLENRKSYQYLTV